MGAYVFKVPVTRSWGVQAAAEGDFSRAFALDEESLTLYRQLGDTWKAIILDALNQGMDVVSGLLRSDCTLVREETKPFLRDLYDHTIQVMDTIETFRDISGGRTYHPDDWESYTVRLGPRGAFQRGSGRAPSVVNHRASAGGSRGTGARASGLTRHEPQLPRRMNRHDDFTSLRNTW